MYDDMKNYYHYKYEKNGTEPGQRYDTRQAAEQTPPVTQQAPVQPPVQEMKPMKKKKNRKGGKVVLCILLALLIVQLIIAPGLSFGRDYILYIWTLHMDELFIFILVACAELILMIDQQEYEEG